VRFADRQEAAVLDGNLRDDAIIRVHRVDLAVLEDQVGVGMTRRVAAIVAIIVAILRAGSARERGAGSHRRSGLDELASRVATVFLFLLRHLPSL